LASKVDRVRVRFQDSYPAHYEIRVGTGLLVQAGKWPGKLGFERASLIADKKLASQSARLKSRLERAGAPTGMELIEASEAAKDYRRLFPLFGKMLEH